MNSLLVFNGAVSREAILPLTYQKYLNLPQLLNLQEPRSDGPEQDELLFIIIHQVYELWFKQIIHEVKFIQNSMDNNHQADIFHGFKRVLSILKVLVSQTDVLETMTPVAFSSFRDRLETSSGFQSVQFRELEILLGKRDLNLISRFQTNDEEYKLLSELFQKPSLWDSFNQYLKREGYNVPDELIKKDFSKSTQSSSEHQQLLIEIYRERSNLMEICERFVDLDEGLQEWRYRHVKMVERTIGIKMGTGGSSGMEYLKATVFTPLFPDLWEIRCHL